LSLKSLAAIIPAADRQDRSPTVARERKMHVSPKTVETFRSRIKEKLGISNLTELIQRAAQWVVECKYQSD
jgi:FixJ family two-component response regulator